MLPLIVNTTPNSQHYKTIRHYLSHNKWLQRTDPTNVDSVIFVPNPSLTLRLRYDVIMIKDEIYALSKTLGKGGFASVYDGHLILPDGSLGKNVAVKIQPLAIQPKHKLEQQIKLTRENGIGAVGPVIGPEYITVNGKTWGVFVLPKADCAFDEYIKTASPRNVLRRLLEIVYQLEIMHESGFVHLDLKMDNVLILDGSAYISDFGISHPIGKEIGLIDADPAKYPQCPPERFGAQCCKVPLNPSFDGWSFGYMLLTCTRYKLSLIPVLKPLAEGLRRPTGRMLLSNVKMELQKLVSER